MSGGLRREARARRTLLLLASVGLALAGSALAASGAAAFKGLESPSHNIGCILEAHGARCDIRDHSWKTPKKPKSCEFDYGALFIGPQGRGSFGCVSDSAFGAGPVLPYGQSLRKGRFVCTSEEVGMRCVNSRNGHGFFVSKQRVKLF